MSNKPKVILLIVIDSLRADRMSCYGYRLKTTPFLDSVLDDFVKFEWAFSTCSYTLPSMTSILTGKYPSEHYLGLFQTTAISLQLIDLLGAKFNYEKELFIQEILHLYGFTTVVFYSTPIFIEKIGFLQGFDMHCVPDKRLSCNEVTEKLWLMVNNKNYPFFCFIHYGDTHIPYSYGYENNIFHSEKYCNRRLKKGPRAAENTIINCAVLSNKISSAIYESSYDSSIYLIDREIGKIIEKLKKERMYEDSCIIITADHGEFFGEDNLFCNHSLNLHPSLLRVPLLIKFPYSNPANTRGILVKQVVSTKDLYYTILDICNIKISTVNIERSFLRLLKQKAFNNNKPIYAFHPIQKATINDEGNIIDIKVRTFYLPYVLKKAYGSFLYTARWKYSKDTQTLKICDRKHTEFIKDNIEYSFVSDVFKFIFLFLPLLHFLLSLCGIVSVYDFLKKVATSIKR